MWNIILSSLLLAVLGTIFLRLSGRKSISQMTAPQIVILLTIGAILGSEVGGKGLTYSIVAAATFILFLVGMEWIGMKWNFAETAIKGKAVVVISEGKLDISNLRMLRMSVDDLEKRLRIAGISRIQDVKSGSIEDNGEFGYDLFPHAKPVTIGDLERILGERLPTKPLTPDLFSEVEKGSHLQSIPKDLH